MVKQMINHVGIARNSERFIRQSADEDPEISHLVTDFLGDSKNLMRVSGNLSFCTPLSSQNLSDHQDVLQTQFGQQLNEILVGHRLKKGDTVFYSLRYKTKGNSCSYLMQYVGHDGTC